MRVVLDTNILISALLSPSGAPARLVRAWWDGRFVLVSNEQQMEELRQVTRRERVRVRLRPADAGRLVNRLARAAEMAETLPAVERSPDPRDDFLLALCEAAVVDRLVTGDKDDLLALVSHGATRIVTAAALTEELRL